MDVIRKIPDLKRAMRIFARIADDETIAHDYVQTGCAARAHVACRAIIDEGYAAHKAWAFRQGDMLLGTVTADGESAVWDYHVAAALQARLPGGRIEALVLDPALFSGPTTLQEWAGRINAQPGRTEITPYGERPRGGGGSHAPNVDIGEKTDCMTASEMMMRRGMKPPPLRVVFTAYALEHEFSRVGIRAPREGKTWISSALRAARLYQEMRDRDRNEDLSGWMDEPFRLNAA